MCIIRRCQLQRGLRRRSAAARLLRLWVRIPPGAWMFVCCECCQVEVSATSWSLVQRSPTDCGVSLCVISKNLKNEEAMERDWVASVIEKKICIIQPIPTTFNVFRTIILWALLVPPDVLHVFFSISLLPFTAPPVSSYPTQCLLSNDLNLQSDS